MVEVEVADSSPSGQVVGRKLDSSLPVKVEQFLTSSDSSLSNHPGRTCEAYYAELIEAKSIHEHLVPREAEELESLVEWFAPLLEAESAVEGRPPMHTRGSLVRWSCALQYSRF